MMLKAKVKVISQQDDDLNLPSTSGAYGYFYFRSEDVCSFLVYESTDEEYIIELFLKDKMESLPIVYTEAMFTQLKDSLND